MLNQFRTQLVNLADDGTVTDYIAPGFVPAVLRPELQDVYNLLFPVATTRDQRLALAGIYENIVRSTTLTPCITEIDERISYKASEDLDFFHEDSVEHNTIIQNVLKNESKVLTMLHRVTPLFPEDTTPDAIWRGHKNNVYRVAGLLIAYNRRVAAQ